MASALNQRSGTANRRGDIIEIKTLMSTRETGYRPLLLPARWFSAKNLITSLTCR